jgi:malic enzyme
MCVAAAEELAKCARERGIDENNICPTMDEWKVFVNGLSYFATYHFHKPKASAESHADRCFSILIPMVICV